MFKQDGAQVVKVLDSTGESHIIGTFHNDQWARTVTHLLNTYHAGDGSTMVRIEGNDLALLRNMLSGKDYRTPRYLRADQRGDTIAFKVNEGCWTHGMGKHEPPY